MNDKPLDGNAIPDPVLPNDVTSAASAKVGTENPYVAPGIAHVKDQKKGSYVGIGTAISVFVVSLGLVAAWSALRPGPAIKPDLDYLCDDAVVVATQNLSEFRS